MNLVKSNKKYELTSETKKVCGYTLYRIKAVKDFKKIKAGTLGGWIEKEENLSHDGLCWVTGNAYVTDNARVTDNAYVTGNARVTGNAWVAGNAWVTDNAWVADNALIKKTEDVLVVGPLGSRNSYTTFYKGCDNQIYVHCGCFLDTIDKFTDKVISTHGEHKHRYLYEAAINMAKLQINVGRDNP